MINLANSLEEGSFGIKLVDHIVRLELEMADLNIKEEEVRVGEPRTKFTGELLGWIFERAWNYWIVKATERPIPVEIASEMHDTVMDNGDKYGMVIRTRGDCTCPHPLRLNEWFFNKKIVLSLSEKLKYEECIASGLLQPDAMDRYYFHDDPAAIGAIKGVNSYHIDTQLGLNFFAKTLLVGW